jgi:threonine-phosphate decarboxylase
MIQGHGGNIFALARQLNCEPAQITDMSSNINPLGSPPGLMDHLKSRLHAVSVLPEVDNRSAVELMAQVLGVDSGCLLAGHGTTQFIYSACGALGTRTALIVTPTYADYADACRMHGIVPRAFPAAPQDGFVVDTDRLDRAIEDGDLVFICNPNNPTGALIPGTALEGLCRRHPGAHFMIDESYLPFAADGQSHSMIGRSLENAGILYSVSKIFGIPGLRAGFLVACPSTIQRFERLAHPWSLNSLAQEAIHWLGRNPSAVHEFIQRTRDYLNDERRGFVDSMSGSPGITLYPSVTSYLLIRLPSGLTADAVCAALAREHILIRNCSNFKGLSNQYIRVALKASQINRMAAARLSGLISGHSIHCTS